MDRVIFVSLPVRDLAVARAFYAGLGFTVDAGSGDDDAACVLVSRAVRVMLLRRDRWAAVTHRADGVTLLGLGARSPAEVDAMAEAAVAGGGAEVRAPQEAASLYARAVRDPDGHVWEILHAAC
ncbi:Glyoxalase/bleomycin resistance protein/dioxygenase [Cellulomonas flavigena DSM 20109]|uniref:Glyoxalase/bleomycin resistance protein/dioxygenase n=1 Tax=Cellulomonas flavigena (strain ATCC 482 / DSM 20109 / BCRC 11376 / JCM 18109 / NBRC 3775 / NCIMB 8073 / NRS 134) TaxID=446466 RepID=D5UGN8_CELFN|nr:VOC family protein [Cellulomonas flavigena]ADG75136.1 Glyoxalase/bleomycin resistance protein/dioxygenase [Cellulomonas flavigena DSM 20109]